MVHNNRALPRLSTSIALQFLLPVTLTVGVFTATTKPSAASEPAPRMRLTQIEVRLLRDFIDHHYFAIQISQVCLQKATRQQLKSICEEVITAQRQEIQTMRSWLINWYGIQYEPTTNKMDASEVSRLGALNGSRFEIEFMKTLASHHWGAIIMGGEVIDRAYHHNFVDLAADIVTAQTSEIAQLQTMLRNNYGIRYRGAAVAGSAAVNSQN